MWIYENIQLLSVWNEILKTSKNVESYCKREWTECFNARLTEVSARFIWEFASLPHKFFPEHLKLSREVDTTAFVCTYVLKKRGQRFHLKHLVSAVFLPRNPLLLLFLIENKLLIVYQNQRPHYIIIIEPCIWFCPVDLIAFPPMWWTCCKLGLSSLLPADVLFSSWCPLWSNA